MYSALFMICGPVRRWSGNNRPSSGLLFRIGGSGGKAKKITGLNTAGSSAIERNSKSIILIMISKVPIDIKKIKGKSLEREVLRIAIAAEFDAISLYEQLAAIVDSKDIKDVLLDVAKEEKTHVGEFSTLLLKYDDEQSEELKKGRKEVEEIERV